MASPSTSSSISTPFQDVVQHFNYRRLLLHGPLYPVTTPTVAATPPAGNLAPGSYTGENSFDTHVVMVLCVLLCALICALGLNSIIGCLFRRSNLGVSSPVQNSSARLANTGIKKKALKTFPVVSYTAGQNLPGLDSECVICLSEFTNGERLKVLPKCNHGFHVRCIDKWLNLHSTCPTCRHCLIETCHKIVGCNQGTSTTTPPPPPPLETIVAIVPLEPERFMINYR